MAVDKTGQKIRDWVEARKERVRDDWDELIIMTGKERSGKSTTARAIARKIDPEFDPVKQFAATSTQFQRKALKLPPYKPIILDESIDGAFGRDAMSKPNKELAKHFTICGDRNLIAFVCWPSPRFLDVILREWRSTWNLHQRRRWRDGALVDVRQFHEDEIVYDPPRVHFDFIIPKIPLDDVDRACARIKKDAQEARLDPLHEAKERLYHHMDDTANHILEDLLHGVA